MTPRVDDRADFQTGPLPNFVETWESGGCSKGIRGAHPCGGVKGGLHTRYELVANAAGANPVAAAVEHDRQALIAQPNNFSRAQGSILRSRFGDREVAILN